MSRNITRLKLRSRQGGVAAQSILCRICCPKNGLESELQPAALPLFVNIFKNISTTSSVNVSYEFSYKTWLFVRLIPDI